MTSKTFTSPNGWFSLKLPANWDEYDDEEGTSAFFNSKSWTGNFRVTPIRWTGLADPNEDKAAKYILAELKENKIATKVKLGNYDCAFYKNELIQDDTQFIIYYWTTGKGNTAFICSFTIDKKQEATKLNQSELEQVQG